MEVKVEKVNSVQCRLELVFSAQDVNKAFEQASRSIQKIRPIQGFRPEKAPLSIAIKKYGQILNREAMELLLKHRNLAKVVDAHIQNSVGSPQWEKAPVIEFGADYACSLLVDVKPEIILDDRYQSLSFPAEKFIVTDQCVDRYLESEAKRYAAYTNLPEETVAAIGQFALVDVECFAQEEPFYQDQLSFELKTPSQEAQSWQDALTSTILNHKKGEECHTTFDSWTWEPLNAKHLDYKDQPVQVKLKISDLKHIEVPAIDDQFAQKLKEESLEALKNKIKEYLDLQAVQLSHKETTDKLGEVLWTIYPFEVPPILVDMTIDSMIEREIPIQKNRLSQILQNQEVRKALLSPAKMRVHYSLVLIAIAQKEGLHITKEELEQFKSEHKSYEFFNEEHVEKSLIIDKTQLFLLEKAKIDYTEKPVFK